MDLKAILADKAKFADNLAWTLENGVTVTLGQLRGLGSEQQTALSKRETELETARNAFTARETELKTAQLNTANLYTTVQSAIAAIKAGKFDDPSVVALYGNNTTIPGVTNNNTDPFAALTRLESDTLMGPVITVLKLINQRTVDAQSAVAQNFKVQEEMAKNYLNDQLEDRYSRIVPADKQGKITLEELIKHAVTNQQFTRSKMPDISRAYRDMTAGDTAAAREVEIRADERKKIEKEMQEKGLAVNAGDGKTGEIFISQPGSIFGLDVHNRSGSAPQPFKNLDEAFAAAGRDKDIWAQVDNGMRN